MAGGNALNLDSLIAAHQAAPGLDPTTAYGVASQAPSPQDAAVHAQAIEGFASAQQFHTFITHMDSTTQRSIWTGLSGTEQKMLQSVGYNGPPRPGGAGGFLHGLLGGIGHALSAVPAGLGRGFSDVLGVLGAGSRLVQRGLRTAEYVAEEGAGNPFASALDAGVAPGGWGKFFDPHEWATAWREVRDGASSFNPGILRKLSQQYDPATLELAKKIATITPNNFFGSNAADPKGIANITKGMTPVQAQAVIDRMNGDKGFQNLVSTLVDSKLNFGNFLVGEKFMHDHGRVAKAISGVADATVDFFGDPVIIGGKATKAYQMGRYMVQTAEQADQLYQKSKNVKAAYETIASFTSKVNADGTRGDYAGLIRAMPKLAPMSEELAKAAPQTADDVNDFFKSKVGFQAFLQGRAGGLVGDEGKVLPYLSPMGRLGLAAKGFTRQSINWSAERTSENSSLITAKLMHPLGRLGQSLTRLVPEGTTLKVGTPGAVTTVQRLADLFLPDAEAKDLVNTWVGADIGVKRNVFKGLLSQMFDVAHLNDSAETQTWAKRFLGQFDESQGQRIFTTAEDNGTRLDQQVIDGVPISSGFLEGHLQDEWHFPSFGDLLSHSNRANVGRRLIGTVNGDITSRFMNSVWKPLMLMRFGFPIRAGGEELFGAILRTSPLGLARARLGFSGVSGQLRAAAGDAARAKLESGAKLTAAERKQLTVAAVGDRVAPWHPLRFMTQHLTPQAFQQAVQSPRDLVAQYVGDRARRAFRNVETRLAGEEYVKAAKAAFDAGYLDNATAEEISAIHSHGMGYFNDQKNQVRYGKDGKRLYTAAIAPSGLFKSYENTDPLYLQVYKKELDDLGNSAWARVALEHFGDPDEAKRLLADRLEQDSSIADHGSRFSADRAGNRVGIDITQRQALEDWADVIHRHVGSLITAPDGQEISGIRQYLLDNKEAPSISFFNDIDERMLPLSVKGPEMIPRPISRYRELVTKGFDETVGRPMNWMIRQPLWLHNFALERRSVAPGLIALFGEGKQTEQRISDVAAEAATRRTIPYIHNPQLRSQFSTGVSNLSPFWFAQEQFYKRWVHNLQYAPEAFRKAQLLMGGLRSYGFLHTDDQGNDFFIYPVIGQAVTDVLQAATHAVTGHDISLPIPVSFTGDVKFVTPGLERLGVPSFGPLVSVPLKLVVDRFPELQPVEQSALGRGAATSIWQQFVPTTISRLLTTAFDKPETSQQYASAMFDAMRYLDANGFGVPNNASPEVQQAYIDRVKSWTRSIFMVRTLLGFAAPASPTIDLDPQNLNTQLRELMSQLPEQEALSEFIKLHPDATAYTVFSSKGVGKAPLPSTAQSAQVMLNNREFLSAHPLAAAWFIPQVPGTFDQAAYNEQLALGLRELKTPQQILTEIKYAEASGTYFASEKNYKAAVAGAHGTLRTRLTQSWDQWKAAYFTAHPVFADALQGSTAKLDRGNILDDVRAALRDPAVLKGKQTDDIAKLVESYDNFVFYDNALKTRPSSIVARRQAALSFSQWADQFVIDNPDAAPFFQRLIQPDVVA